MTAAPVRLGVIGLGRAFTLMLPTFAAHPCVRLVAAADPRSEALARFASDFEGAVYADAADLCADANVNAVYIASPHAFHVQHVQLAATAGKHILVEKPMALTVDDCLAMIAVANAYGVHLIVGHSHSFDLPYLRTRELIDAGLFGRVRMINALNFTDFLYRPRRPEELDTVQGGGAVFNQAAHQIDVVRLLAGSPAVSVRAQTGAWDPARPTEGAYAVQIRFEGGAFAALTYSGYGRFDTDELMGWRGELGQRRDPNCYGEARRALAAARTAEVEAALKERRAYGPAAGSGAFRGSPDATYNHFGFVVVSCERADLRPQPEGVTIYGDVERWTEPLPRPLVPRSEVIDELHAAVIAGHPPLHSGKWGLATLEICLAIIASSKEGRDIALHHQI